MKTEQKEGSAPEKKKKGFEAPKTVARILAVLLGLFTVVGLLCFNVWRILFNPPLVKETLLSEVVSSNIVPATLEVFSEWRADQRVQNKESLSGVNEPDIVLLMSFLDAENWLEIKELLVTEEFVNSIVSSSVDGLYAWIDSDDIWPDINWDMTLLKERIAGQEGVDAIMVAYMALPEATEEDITDFQLRLSQVPAGVEVLYNLARYPAPWYDDQVGDYMDALDTANDNIPVTFNFSREFGQTASGEALVQIKGQVRMVRFITVFGWIFALFLLVLIVVLKVRNRRSLGKYVGIPLIIGGALSVVIALIGQSPIIRAVIESLMSGTSEFARMEFANSFSRLAALFFRPLLMQGAVIAGLGAVFIALRFFKRAGKEGTVVPGEEGIPKTVAGENI